MKMLIIACNTMAAVAVDVVHRLARDIPVLDVIEAGGARCGVELKRPAHRRDWHPLADHQ